MLLRRGQAEISPPLRANRDKPAEERSLGAPGTHAIDHASSDNSVYRRERLRGCAAECLHGRVADWLSNRHCR